jgi:hypothetical protein
MASAARRKIGNEKRSSHLCPGACSVDAMFSTELETGLPKSPKADRYAESCCQRLAVRSMIAWRSVSECPVGRT